MTESSSLVIDLLTYIEQVEKLKSKPTFVVPGDFFVAYQHELKGLPGLQFNLQNESDDIWMRVPRLQEIAPPDIDEKLKIWVTLPKSPEDTPVLKAEAVIVEGKDKGTQLRIEKHPEIKILFDAYVQKQWQPWAAAERPRRKTINRYNQLFALQQAIASEGAETPIELVWGLGYATWKKNGFSIAVKHPLIVQPCEVILNEKNFDLEVRPRDVEPRLEVDCYTEMELPGTRQLEAFWKSFIVSSANRVNPFEDSTFDGVLKSAVGHLDSTGTYEVRTDDVTPPALGDKLQVSNTWVLFARKRSGDILLEDIRRLKKSIEATEDLPRVIRSFVEHGDSTVRANPSQPFRGLSSSGSREGAFELYFPMAYNDEQVSIVQKLESNDGVVVQGPPGTGKTHTIANVICHYLAQGKRILVTAKSESALAVLQEKLPERIRPLSVSLLSDERDGMKQFEHSIQMIATSVASMNPERAEENVAAAEERLNQMHAKISHLDQSISDYASKHMRKYVFQGQEVLPEEIAKLVMRQAEDHQWLDDQIKSGPPPFDENQINSLRQARLQVGQHLKYLNHSLPATDELPAWTDLLALHRDVQRARAIESNVNDGRLLGLIDAQYQTFEKAKALAEFLNSRLAIKKKLAATNQAWLEILRSRIADKLPTDIVLGMLLQCCEEIRTLEAQRQALLVRAAEIPVDAESNEDFREAIARLVAGKSAFGLPFGRSDARKFLAATTVLGSVPATQEEWMGVQHTLQWRMAARKCVSRWNSLSAEFGLDVAGSVLETAFKKIAQARIHIEDLHNLVFNFDASLHAHIEGVFGKATAEKVWDGGEAYIDEVSNSLQAHLDKGRLSYAMKRIGDLVQKLQGCTGDIVHELREFLTNSVGQQNSNEVLLQKSWVDIQARLSKLTSLRSAFDEIARMSSVLDAAGAIKWAERIRILPAGPEEDPFLPVRWLEAWNWRQAFNFLERIDGHHKLQELFEERRTLTTALARTYQDLVAEKTWLGVYRNSPDSIRQALQAYLNAVQAMGKGTGVRAIRHRKTARDAMTRAYQAVPCWVLPQWRVSETIPPEVRLFDLVVIDEASQSDIWALPALLRGKKLLVVGDHKQVSPSAVGTAEEKIKEISNRFLNNQPHGSEMTPDKSIYDLARVVFAGNSVMLKEHFRCVPAIIEFSNREFYGGDIKPLRLPKANERLDPPLVDVYVKGGARHGDVNKAEAKAIVDEIEAILADKKFDDRSIGVVTLLGTTQAAHIHELINRRISPIDVISRKIAIGPPPVFQGRERDIMFISMVLSPGDRAAASKADMDQRFNVALSRARDRMYLFRSVAENAFKEETLNARLIRHFRKPFTQDARKVQDLRERCESGFEREMFDELVKRGFRVEPQVLCGGYRIDFVVEGNEGRRLAIECDGDQFHGPGKWSEDMARQRVLERAGWTFWRCFASSFARTREAVITDLLNTLEKLGIEPLGAESVDNTVWVHSKEVDPYGVDNEEAQTA